MREGSVASAASGDRTIFAARWWTLEAAGCKQRRPAPARHSRPRALSMRGLEAATSKPSGQPRSLDACRANSPIHCGRRVRSVWAGDQAWLDWANAQVLVLDPLIPRPRSGASLDVQLDAFQRPELVGENPGGLVERLDIP